MKDEDNKPGLKVLEFKKPEPKETEDDITPDTILNGAMDRLESVIVAGWSKDGSFYLATSLGAISENLMMPTDVE